MTFRAYALVLATAGSVGLPPAVEAPNSSGVRAPSLVGTVTDVASGVALAGAQLSVEGSSAGSLTDAAGAFEILFQDGWVGREVEVVARLIGYSEARRTVALTAGENRVSFALASQAMKLDAIGVTGGVAAEATGGIRLRGSPTPVAFGGIDARRTLGPVASPPSPYANGDNREQYAYLEENDFRSTVSEPLSTFSIDVDRASYANVRRFLRDGHRPPVDAVRIEELINYFPYSDPAPRGTEGAPFAIRTEVGPAPWQPAHRLVRVALKARDVALDELPPSNLVFLLDVSGSMAFPDKLPLVKSALHMLVERLRPEDRVAITVYAGAAGLVLPSTPGSDKEAILGAIDRLEAGGSTAGGAGLELAYRVARENYLPNGNNRVILATDGDFNVGASSDSEMIRLIEEKREQGTFLTVLGFGTGNLQDAKMEQIADHGNGSYAYIDSRLEARKALVHEMGGTLLTLAKDVKIQVEFNPARVAAYRLIGYENRLMANQDFADDTKDAGELGAGHSVVALYEVVPVGVESPVLASDDLRYQEVRPVSGEAASSELLYVKLRYKEPKGTRSRLIERAVADVDERRDVRSLDDASTDFRFSAAVAAWGMLLRESEHCGDMTFADVMTLARGALGDDPGGYRAEFLGLVASSLALDVESDER